MQLISISIKNQRGRKKNLPSNAGKVDEIQGLGFIDCLQNAGMPIGIMVDNGEGSPSIAKKIVHWVGVAQLYRASVS